MPPWATCRRPSLADADRAERGDAVVASIFVNRLHSARTRTSTAIRALSNPTLPVLRTPCRRAVRPDEQEDSDPQVYRVQLPPLAGELKAIFGPGFFEGVHGGAEASSTWCRRQSRSSARRTTEPEDRARMVRSSNMPIQIVPGETGRADDGLALARATATCACRARRSAPPLPHAALDRRRDAGVATIYANLESAGRADLHRHGWRVEIIAVRTGWHAHSASRGFDPPELLIVLAAAKLAPRASSTTSTSCPST